MKAGLSLSPTLLAVPGGCLSLPRPTPLLPLNSMGTLLLPLMPHQPLPWSARRRQQLRGPFHLFCLRQYLLEPPPQAPSTPTCRCKLPWKGKTSASPYITSFRLPRCSPVWSHPKHLGYRRGSQDTARLNHWFKSTCVVSGRRESRP